MLLGFPKQTCIGVNRFKLFIYLFNYYYSIFNCMSEWTSIYLFILIFFLTLFLDLFVCSNVSMPPVSCKGLQLWPLSVRWPEE